MFGSSIDNIIELFWKRSKEDTKFMEAEFVSFTGIKINKVVKLNSVVSCKVRKVLVGYVALISVINKPEQIDKVEIIKFG